MTTVTFQNDKKLAFNSICFVNEFSDPDFFQAIISFS